MKYIVKAITNFNYKDIKNVEFTKKQSKKDSLVTKDDEFIVSEKQMQYLTGGNIYKRAFIQVLEGIVEETDIKEISENYKNVEKVEENDGKNVENVEKIVEKECKKVIKKRKKKNDKGE